MHYTCLLLIQSGHTLSSFNKVRYPVEIGLAPSPGQPSRNVTGVAVFATSLSRAASNLFRWLAQRLSSSLNSRRTT